MVYINFDAVSVSFKILCGIVAVFMVGYWIHKFEKNADNSVIQYKYLNSNNGAIYPELSICITNPFLPKKLEDLGSNVSVTDYIQYVYGYGEFHESYNDIDLFDLTLNLSDYLMYVRIRKTDNKWEKHNCSLKNSCPFISMNNNFNGFISGDFTRCFSISIDKNLTQNIYEIGGTFEPKLIDMLTQMKKAAKGKYGFAVSSTLAYPNQFLRTDDRHNFIWLNQNGQWTDEWIIVRAIEVLRRRNKINGPCVEDWMHYDDLVLNKHISSVNCRTPYQKSNVPLCTTTSKIMSSRYDAEIVREKYFPPPCQEITDIKYKSNTMDDIWPGPYLDILVLYPNLMKVISQEQTVDVHALIGNIGGYIGLFLGKI